MNNKNSRIQLIALTGLFAALTTVVTSFIRIPAAHNGYTHAGDSIIYLASCILPAPYAIASASIGGVFADIIAGAPEWAFATAIIKALNTLPFIVSRQILKRHDKDDKILHPLNIAMLLPTSLVTIIGYFIAEGIMYGFETSLLISLISGWLQPLAGAIVFLTVGASLDKLSFKSRIYTSLKPNYKKRRI